MNLLKRYPMTAFFVLAFVLDWTILVAMNVTSIQAPPLKAVAEFAPTIAALIVTTALSGRAGRRALLGQVRRWRISPWWYVLVFLVPAALQVVSIGLFVFFGGPGVQFRAPDLSFSFIFLVGLLTATGEEIGWRGFAFPYLQSRTNLLIASLIIGTLWAVWHIPSDITSLSLLAVPSTYIAFLWFLGSTVTGSVFMGWVYNRTGGSIPLMVLSHLGLTIFWRFVILPEKVGQFSPYDVSVILLGVVAVVLVVFSGAKKAAQVQQPPMQAPVVAKGSIG